MFFEEHKDDEINEENEINEVENETLLMLNIPSVYKMQGSQSYSSCIRNVESSCLCSNVDDSIQPRRLPLVEPRNWITINRLCELRKQAQAAIKEHKIFMIRGCFYSIRKSLLQRGWVEKLDFHRREPTNGSCHVVLEDVTQHLPLRRPGETRRQHVQKCERNIMSRFLDNVPVDLLWSARREKSDWNDFGRNPNVMVNKLNKSPFTTKEGLSAVLRHLHWFTEEGLSETYYPRSYNLTDTDELADFCDDYRLTACTSLLRCILETTEVSNVIDDGVQERLIDDSGKVPLSSIRFAINQCKAYVKSCLHVDIDEADESVWQHDWELFIMQYLMITQEHSRFQSPVDNVQWKSLLAEAKQALIEIDSYLPQHDLDGVMNIWIVKPTNRCRGRGIHLMNDIKDVISFVHPPEANKGRYVVQKYIGENLLKNVNYCSFCFTC